MIIASSPLNVNKPLSMMKNRITKIIILFTVLTACKVELPEQNQLLKKFDLEIRNNPEPSNWDDNIVSVDFIPLETSAEAIMSEIDKIIIKNKRIFIKCRKKGIFIFNMDGKFIRNICLLGKAPFQVNHLFDFSISPDGVIYALDNGKILTFDSDGNPLEETFFRTDASEIGHETNICVYNNDTIYLWHASAGEGSNFHLTRSNIHGKILEMMIPYSHFSFAAARFVQSCSNEWAVTPSSLNDTIYSIFKGVIEKKYILNILDNDRNIEPLVPESSLDFVSSDQLSGYLNKYDLSQVYGDIVYSSNYLFVNLHNLNRGIFKRCMIDVQTGQVKYFDYPFEAENLFHPRKLYLSEDNKFISSLDAFQVRQLITENKTSCSFLSERHRHEILEKLKKVKETDNPVLMLITLKD